MDPEYQALLAQQQQLRNDTRAPHEAELEGPLPPLPPAMRASLAAAAGKLSGADKDAGRSSSGAKADTVKWRVHAK